MNRLQASWELHLSHWGGPLPQLDLYLDWVFRGRHHHLFGRYFYNGRAAHGDDPAGGARSPLSRDGDRARRHGGPLLGEAGLGPFDPQLEADMNRFQDELMANDRLCRQH